jgi:hypothetical protein
MFYRPLAAFDNKKFGVFDVYFQEACRHDFPRT